MENTETIFTAVDNKDFTKFSKAVKTEIDNKLAVNDKMQSYKSDYDKMQSIKQVFKDINTKLKSEE